MPRSDSGSVIVAKRRHARARLIYQPFADLGLTLQARYRYHDNSRTDGPNYYFNPQRYQEGLLAVGWRQRIGHWRTAVTAGAGQQQVTDDPWSSTRLLEASAEKQVAGYGVRLRAGYSRAASPVWVAGCPGAVSSVSTLAAMVGESTASPRITPLRAPRSHSAVSFFDR